MNKEANMEEIKDMCLSAFLVGTGMFMVWIAMWVFC